MNIVLSPLHQESICFMMSYSKENYIVQNFFSLWTMPYKEHFKISYHITYVLIRSWFDTLFIIWFEYFESNQFMIRASNQSLKHFVIHTRSTNHEALHMSRYLFQEKSCQFIFSLKCFSDITIFCWPEEVGKAISGLRLVLFQCNLSSQIRQSADHWSHC